MFSPRIAAQLGVAGACLVLIFSLSVLVAGAADDKQTSGHSISSIAPESASASLGTVDILSKK